MKLHSQFMKEAKHLIGQRLPSIRQSVQDGLLMDIVYISRMGVAAEGSDIAPEKETANYPPIPDAPAIARKDSGFTFSATSNQRLQRLKPELAACVRLALRKSLVDFTVLETSRTLEQQREYMRKGTTRTMKSKHLPQSDGFAHAADLVAWVNGKLSWDFDHYYYIAMAMDEAATELGIANHVRWGCAWDRVLADFGGNHQAYIDEVQAYKKRHAGSDFLDGPHFEWVK